MNLTALAEQLNTTGRVDGLEPSVAVALSGLAANAGHSHVRRLYDNSTGLLSVAVGTPVKPTVGRDGIVKWNGEPVGQVRRRGPGGKSGQWGASPYAEDRAPLVGHFDRRSDAVRSLTRNQGLF